jgi:DNA adenine methylase
MLRTPLKLIGAKTKIRDLLYEFFPKNYKSYVEPFMGSGSVFMGSPFPELEYVGDLNSYAINFFKVLQDDYMSDEFWEYYQFNLRVVNEKGKEHFIHMRSEVTVAGCGMIRRAVYFYMISKLCMNGIFRLNKSGSCNSSYCGQTHGRGFMDRAWFDAVRERIYTVRFREIDYRQLPYNYNSFVFLDPPYSRCKTTYNGIGWADKDFVDFREYVASVNACGARFMVTLNDNEFIRDLFKDYNMVLHDVNYSCSQTNAGRGKKPELIITNYDTTEKAKKIGLTVLKSNTDGKTRRHPEKAESSDKGLVDQW